MLRWSIATVCLGGGLEAKFSAAAKAGFRAVELLENDLTFYAGAARDARALADDLGLDIVALQPLRDFEGAPEPQRRRNFDRAKRKLELTRELGAPLLCLSSSISEEFVARRRPHRLGSRRTCRSRAPVRFAARLRGAVLGPPHQGLDGGLGGRRQGRPRQSRHRSRLFPYLRAQEPDRADRRFAGGEDRPRRNRRFAGVGDGFEALSRHYRCYPGQGDYPVADFLDAVLRSGYRGPISLETYSEQFRGASAASVALDGMRSLQATGEALSARRLAKGEAPAAELAALPPTPAVLGPEFLEFAVSDTEAQELAALLDGLGFRTRRAPPLEDGRALRPGRHQPRRQPGAQRLLPCVRVAARRRGVRAGAARRQRRARARARARPPMCKPHRLSGPGEATVPAIGGVEGSLIYFVDRRGADWSNDFAPETNDRPKGALKAIDHLSNVVRGNEFLSWLLFYETVLGLKADPQIEVYDPHGDFYSRSLRSENGALRIALNIGAGGATGVSRFLDTFGGAGYQQIALSTDDIFAAVEAARRKGVQFLPIPDNYYDDLATRFEIAPDLMQRMREFGVLYDRVEDGQFFHIYTRTFHKRFFFEILQRDNYPLFGAANTPMRLAAQAAVDDAETRLTAEAGSEPEGRAGRRVDAAGACSFRSINVQVRP